MGSIIHDALIVVVNGYVYDQPDIPVPDIEAFRMQIPQELRHLLVGPIRSSINNYHTYFWAPDGSKEGWDLQDLADEWRTKFAELFSFTFEDGDSPYSVISVRFGPDLYRDGLPPTIMRFPSGTLEDSWIQIS
jgi:hypothetical protein